jgi:hypothetical protein
VRDNNSTENSFLGLKMRLSLFRRCALSATMLCSAVMFAQAPAPVAMTARDTAPAAAVPPAMPDLDALKPRVQAYYDTMMKNDRAAAGQFIVAESREQFATVNYTGLRAIRIEKMTSEADGSVSVAVTRTQMVPGFGSMEYPATDVWRPVDGQWYMWLAPLAPPFPVAKPAEGATAKPAPAVTDEQLRMKIAQAEHNVDPDQYMLQLRKAMQADAQRKAEQQAQEEAAKKAQQAQVEASAKNSKKKSKKKSAGQQQ